MDTLAFKRTHLAQAYCDSLEGSGIANARSGLFLTGPRRVGKSTFLIEDLIPEAESRGWLTVYVDLWSNKQIDPAVLITEAIKTSIADQKGRLGKLVDQVKLQKINLLKTFEFDFSGPGLPENITLADALAYLIKLAAKPVLLMIDEAQHALSSQGGINAMFAIKSARDQINSISRSPDLMLTLTGSNRDKLAQLVLKKDQPFFGAELIALPLLGRDYTDFFTASINQALAVTNQFSEDSVWDAFRLTGHRPEILRQLVGRVAMNHEAQSFSDLLKQDAYLWHGQVWEEFETDFNNLSALQKIILKNLVLKDRSMSLFSEESISQYCQDLNQDLLTVSAVQTAIQSLRDNGFIWQSSRGIYALEDENFGEWLKHQVSMISQ